MKECKDCNKSKPFKDFYRSGGRNKDYSQSVAGYQTSCRECVLIKRKSDYKMNPEKYKKSYRAFNLRQSYGLSLKDWDDMFLSQNGCCAICDKHQSDLKKVLAVDHCHASGIVRGLLCTSCNLMIGYAKDSPSILFKSINYLNKFSELAAQSNVTTIKSLTKVG